MSYDIQLKFVRDLMKAMHISTHISINPREKISYEIDLGLRAMLFHTDNYTDILHNSMYDAKSNTIYRFFDEYHCNYLFMRLPDTDDDRFFFIGPYLPSALSEEQIKQKSDFLELNTEKYNRLLEYYNSLPIIEDENILFNIINTLAQTLWESSENYAIEYIEYMIPDQIDPICVSPIYETFQNSPYTLTALENNYANEKKLMDAISKGQIHKVNAIASSVYNNGTQQRLSDSLRNRKNYLIILNTLLRKAAEQGGVHPLHIDRLSSAFAQKIEAVHSIDSSLCLQSTMIRKYCILVNEHSLSNYSYLIGKTIILIAYDITADLSLKSIAKQLSVSPAYLSALFKKECGVTLTDYVNKKRIEHALYLLQNTTKLVHTISYECGIQDSNYFIKIFKKHTGLTPQKYREQFAK